MVEVRIDRPFYANGRRLTKGRHTVDASVVKHPLFAGRGVVYGGNHAPVGGSSADVDAEATGSDGSDAGGDDSAPDTDTPNGNNDGSDAGGDDERNNDAGKRRGGGRKPSDING